MSSILDPTRPADPAAPDASGVVGDRRRVWAAWTLLTLSCAVFLTSQVGRMTGPVGLNHDGENLGVFAMGSHAIREDGWIAPRLGSHLAAHGVVYAHHPPLIFWTTAVSESVLGVHPWVARLPTVLAACSVIPLLYLVIRRVGLAPLPAAAGVVLSVGNPIFFTYAWMVDTPMLTLPLALATLLAWDRARRTGRCGALGVMVSVTVASGWEGLVLVSALAVLGGWWSRRNHRPLRPAVVTATAALITFGAVVGWIWWSEGGLRPLIDQFRYRTGEASSSTGLVDGLWNQVQFLTNAWQLPMLALGPIGVYLATRDRRTRAVTILLTGTVVAYALLFWEAASIHDYWDYWAVAPFAIGFAVIVDRVVDQLGTRLPAAVVTWSVVAVALALPLTTAVGGSIAQRNLDRGVVMAQVVADGRPADQHVFETFGLGEPESWISYVGRDPVVELTRPALDRLAAHHPAWRVIAACQPPEGIRRCARIDDPGAVRRGDLISASAASVARAVDDAG